MLNARHTLRYFMVILAGLALASCGGPPPEDEGFVEDLEEIMPAEPETPLMYKLAPPGSLVVWGDEHGVAATIKLVPGDTIPEHQSEGGVLYALTDATWTGVWGGGEPQDVEMMAGEVRRMEPGTYSFTNSGEEQVELLVAARSDVDLPDVGAVEDPFGPVEQESGTVLLDGEAARVVEFELPVGESAALDPAVPMRVVYAHTDATLRLADRAEATTLMTLAAGEGGGQVGESVILANLGDAPARVVVFEFAD